ncbi:MAG TPA: VOC family protein, partial [Chloroflexota bacterium]
MLDDQRPGTIYWIDHYVIPTEDIDRFEEFHINVLGARTQPTSPERRRQTGIFQDLAAPCHLGGFVQKQPVPPSAGLGKGLPRNGHFIRQQDIDDHLRRLDANHANHTDPVRTSAEGDEGISILWEDPDGNQFEFWAPDRLPEGAMGEETSTKVGRISHGVFESRDLQRTADFFSRYCALEPLRNSDIPSDTLVLPLAAGGRLVFKKVDTLGERTSGFGKLNACHAALVVRDEDFVPSYQKMFA